MPTSPSFTTKTIDDAPKKRVRKTVRKITADDTAKINEQLNSIYKDNGGYIPDMKKMSVKKSHPFFRGLTIIILIAGFLAAAAWAGFFFLPNKNTSKNQVQLTIDGPARAVIGATSTFFIKYNNTQNKELRNLTVSIRYPEGFIFAESAPESGNAGHTEWKITSLKPREKGEISVSGKMYGTIGQEQSFRVFLTYKAENITSEIQQAALFNVATEASATAIAITGPDKATLGSEVEYNFEINNLERQAGTSMELVPILPINFLITSSTPKLNNNKWILPTSTLDNLSFKLKGKFSDSPDISTQIKAGLTVSVPQVNRSFQLAESTLTTELLQNSVSFNLAVNGALNDFTGQPGDILNITVKLINQSKAELKKGVLKLTIDAPSSDNKSVLNWPEIADKYDGDIRGEQLSPDVRRGKITWTGTNISSLSQIKPNDEVNVDVRLPIKDNGTFSLSDLKTSSIALLAEITYTDSTGASRSISSNPITITLNSDLKFESRDNITTNAQEKEEHHVNWVITNNFHPLKNVALTADVYGDVTWKNDSTTPAGTVTYDTTQKRIVWIIPDMPESVDVLALPFTITINKKNPTQNVLVSKVHIQADDTVTGGKLDFMSDEVRL